MTRAQRHYDHQRQWLSSQRRQAFHFLAGPAPPAPEATPVTLDTARQWLTGFTRAAFARAKAGLGFQPVRRAILDDSELVAVGAIDELFARLTLFLKETKTMPPTPNQPAVNAGNHAQVFAALPPDVQAAVVSGVQQAQAAGFDLSKLTQLIQLAIQYGPQIAQAVQAFIAIFGGTAAQPAAATPPKP